MKLASLILLLSVNCLAQVKTVQLDKTLIPKSIAYSGKIIDAVKYTDVGGDNIIITTETGAFNLSAQNGSKAALYAQHYILKNNSWQLDWKIYDFIDECPVDLEVSFLENTFAVTDLDKDGNAEAWVMYRLVCRGDVSPSQLKIIMYEGSTKYAVRGESRIIMPDVEQYGGTYTFDTAFTQGPKVFKDYATKLWDKNVIEKMH